MVSVGCNDLDRNGAQKVFDDVKKLVEKLHRLYPGIKVIVGEITPRMDAKDELVKEVNALINTFIETTDNAYIIRNSNLRHQKFFYDGDPKHIRRNCIGRYAANIKHALRVAYGRKKYVPTPTPAQESRHAQRYHQTSTQQQYHEQLQLLLSLLFANQHQNLTTSVSNSGNGEGPWIINRVTDSRVLDVDNERTT